MKKLLVIGGSGLFGSKIAEIGSKTLKVTATYNENLIKTDFDLVKLDITKKREVFDLIKEINPDFIVYTAACTDVDLCEIKKNIAWKINVKGTKNILDVCKQIGSKLIYISTDFVFDGKKGMYTEEDKPNPLNWYGETKLEGENAIRNSSIDYLIVRTSVLYGWSLQNKPNFATWVINKLENKEKINIVRDQWNSPTFANNCADVLLELIKRNENGLFHVAGSERINRFDFAKMISEVFDLNADLIKPVMSNELKQRAKRPKDSSLDINKAKKELSMKFFGVKQGLEAMKSLKI